MKQIGLGILTLLTLNITTFASTLSKEPSKSSLLIYNSNVALVHEERNLDVTKEDTSITYEGVAPTLNTDSINVSLDPSLTLYSQQFRFDKLTQAKLLQAYIGKKVEVRLLKDGNSFQVVAATLLAYNGATSIVRTIDYKILTVKSDNIIFDDIPQELITKPSLVWNIKAHKDLHSQMKLDYLINNISFKSNYILNIDANSSELLGWITIDNHSGKRFENTKLSLLAGDVNFHKENIHPNYKRAMLMDATPVVKEQAFEGYHFYKIPFNVTIANNEKTQIRFVNEHNISTQRVYSATLSNPLYFHGQRKVSINQFISLEGLAIPLPKGTIRSYSKLDNQTILIGENQISHTPKNSAIKLNIGKNFDLSLLQSATKRQDSKNWFNVDMLYTLKNDSNEDKEVTLLIPFNTNATSKIRSEEKYTFTKGNLVTFTLQIKANTIKELQVNFESKK